MADSSFDVVSKLDSMEIENAVNQARKEIEQRYDFKGVGAEINLNDKVLLLKANTEERVLAVLDVVQSKFIKRGMSLKALDSGDPYPSGKETRIEVKLKEGIDQATAKKINKDIKDQKLKVKVTIEADKLRVSSASKDALQTVIQFLRDQDYGQPLQFTNYR